MKNKTKKKYTAEEVYSNIGDLKELSSTVIIMSEPDEETLDQEFSVFRFGEKIENRTLKVYDNKWIEIA